MTFCLAVGLPPAFQNPAERAECRRIEYRTALPSVSMYKRGAFSRHRVESRDVLSGCLDGGSRDIKKVHPGTPILQLVLQTNLMLQLQIFHRAA